MAWDVVDFTVFGAMLLGVGVIYKLATRTADNSAYRFAIGVALAAAFILIWVPRRRFGLRMSLSSPGFSSRCGYYLPGCFGMRCGRNFPKVQSRGIDARANWQLLSVNNA